MAYESRFCYQVESWLYQSESLFLVLVGLLVRSLAFKDDRGRLQCLTKLVLAACRYRYF
jgi:hypothetical protein